MTTATGSRGRSSTISKIGRFFSGTSSNNNNNNNNSNSDNKNSGIDINYEKNTNNTLFSTSKHYEVRYTSTNSTNSMKTNNTNASTNTSLSRKSSKRKTTTSEIKNTNLDSNNNSKNFSTHLKESGNDSRKLSSVKSNSSIISNTPTVHSMEHNIININNHSIDHSFQPGLNVNHSINTAIHNNKNNNNSLISNDINFSRSSSVRTTNGAHSTNINPSTITSTTSNNNNNNNNNLSNSNYHVRFKVLPDGNHEHHLARVKRQEKLGQMVKDWIGGDDKKRNKAISAVPNIFNIKNDSNLINSNNKNLPPSLFSTYLEDHNNNNNSNNNISNSNIHEPKFKLSLVKGNKGNNQNSESFFEKYGKCQEIIGRGTFGIIRLSHKKINNKEEQLFAVKEFTRKINEPDSKYSKRLTYEFCISSSLKHESIINAFDLFKDSKGDYYEVMEYCSGGDLYSLIVAAGKLEYLEADCFFKQIMRAVHYMHNMGVSHRDLKPENILLTQNGRIKITDFGSSECFKTAWEDEIELSNKIKGSSPYIAPEEYTNDEFDPRFVDVWSCGVIYMAMRTGRQLWKEAKLEDEFFYEYLRKRKCEKGYEPIEMLKRARCRNVIYSILDPIPERRITTLQILNSEWVREINCCTSK